MLRFATIAVAVSFLSFPAAASQCPGMAAAIDAALAGGSVSEEVRVQVVELRDQGMAAHEAGNHAESVELLGQAQALIESN